MTRNAQSTLQRQLKRGGALAHDGLDKKAVVEAAHELGLPLFVANCDPAPRIESVCADAAEFAHENGRIFAYVVEHAGKHPDPEPGVAAAPYGEND